MVYMYVALINRGFRDVSKCPLYIDWLCLIVSNPDLDPSLFRSAGCIASPVRGRKGLATLSCAFGMQLKVESHDWNFKIIIKLFILWCYASIYCPRYHPTGKGGGFDLHEINCHSPGANTRIKCPHHRTILFPLLSININQIPLIQGMFIGQTQSNPHLLPVGW